MLELVEIEPAADVRHSVIWLHGLGADGNDFAPLVRQWNLAEETSTRFIMPHAPHRPVTVNNGMVMRAWYDITSSSLLQYEDENGIRASEKQLQELLERENRRGISMAHIILAGFSQGGAIVLHSALRMEEPPAAVLALSTYLPLADTLAAEKRAAGADLEIRMDHGNRDPVVPLPLARRSCEQLESEGYKVEFNVFPMEHSLCIEQADSLRQWFAERLA